MKIAPYLAFNGDCAEAIALYEKAFGVTADEPARYKDAPPAEGYEAPESTGDFIMHAQLTLGGDAIYLCDTTPDNPCNFSNGLSVHVSFGSEDALKAAFDVLKQGGEAGMEPERTFWAQCFGTVTDKFGVSWMLSFEQCGG
jgi:PhnB protein